MCRVEQNPAYTRWECVHGLCGRETGATVQCWPLPKAKGKRTELLGGSVWSHHYLWHSWRSSLSPRLSSLLVPPCLERGFQRPHQSSAIQDFALSTNSWYLLKRADLKPQLANCINKHILSEALFQFVYVWKELFRHMLKLAPSPWDSLQSDGWSMITTSRRTKHSAHKGKQSPLKTLVGPWWGQGAKAKKYPLKRALVLACHRKWWHLQALLGEGSTVA